MYTNTFKLGGRFRLFNEQKLLAKILIIPAILIGLTVHEYAHGRVADRMGDDTPRLQGRLTLNPLVHIDVLGFIMILLIGFGWAKPVEVNPNAFKNGYKDDIKVSVAGVVANLVTAFIFALLAVLLFKYNLIGSSRSEGDVKWIVGQIMLAVVSINCMLAVFNIIPLPGLDGFHILRDLFPKAFYKMSGFMYRYNLLILVVFIWFLGDIVIAIPSMLLNNFFFKIAFAIFGL